MQPQPWMTNAKCNGMDPTLFDWQPASTGPKAHTAEQLRAAQLCDGCPVLQQCARFAHQIRPSETIYAGIAFPDMESGKQLRSTKIAYQRLAMTLGINNAAPPRRKPGPDTGTKLTYTQQRRTHCANNHELSGDNVYVVVRADGREKRKCLTCKRESSRRAWQRQQERRATSA